MTDPQHHSRQSIQHRLCQFVSAWILAGLLGLTLLAACTPKEQLIEAILTDSSTVAPTSTTTTMPDTDTPEPPTDTPVPPTNTITPTKTTSPTPTSSPTPVDTATPTSPPPTASGEEAIYVYYVQLDTGGPVACGDSVIKVNTGAYRTGNTESDVASALSRLFNKQEYIGNLYNPVFRSNWKIQSINFKAFEGLVEVFLDGAYVRSGDRCDDSRVRAQIWSTIRQFPDVKTVYILLNGNLLGDILATGK